MAVARKTQQTPHILLGEVGESFSGELTSVAVPITVELPTPIGVTVGTDGLLIAARSTLFGPSITLDQWPGSSPYVSGEVYFIPWEGIKGIDTGATETSQSAVLVHHVDGYQTGFELKSVSDPGRLMDACRGLPCGSENLTANPALIADIARVLMEAPLLTEEEILETLRDEHGWTECTRSDVDVILWADDLPYYFHSHLWFVDEESYQAMQPLGEFVDEVLEVVALEGMSAEEILDNITTVDLELADIYEVLFDPNLPIFTRSRAWYFHGEIEEEQQ